MKAYRREAMKRIMHSKSILHRMTALAMTVVMVLTLVVADSNFHLFAEGEEATYEEIDISDFFKDGSDSTGESVKEISKWTNKDGVQLVLKSEESSGASEVSADDVRYMSYTPGVASDTNAPATSTDSASLKIIDNKVKWESGSSIMCLAVYMKSSSSEPAPGLASSTNGNTDTATETYTLVGKVTVSLDNVNPTVTADVTTTKEEKDGVSNYKEVTDENDKTSYYLVNTDAEIEIEVTPSDGDDANKFSGIAKVEYTTDDGKSCMEISAVNGKYTLKLDNSKPSGSYKFRATDKAGNVGDWSSDSIVIKRLTETLSIDSITPELNKKTYTDSTSLNYWLLDNDAVEYKVKVTGSKAYGLADGESVAATVHYMWVDNEGKAIGSEATANVVKGEATFNISSETVTGENSENSEEQKEHYLVIKAVDELGNATLWKDAKNGHIVFVKKNTPKVTISGIIAGGVSNASLEDYNASTENKWTNKVTFTVGAESDYTYLESLTYAYAGKTGDAKAAEGKDSGNVYSDLAKYKTESVSVDAGKNSGLSLGDGITTITYTATDYAGNKGIASIDVYIDNTQPEVSIKGSGKTEEGYTAGSAETLTLTYRDAMSGVKDASATVTKSGTESKTTKYTYSDLKAADGKIVLSETGTYTVSLEAVDNAGNKATVTTKEITVNADKLESSLTVTVGEDTLVTSDDSKEAKYYTNGSAGDIKVTYKVSGYALGADCVNEDFAVTPFGGTKEETISVDKEVKNGETADGTKKAGFNTVSITYTLDKSKQGLYDVSVTANKKGLTDKTETRSVSFYYDKEAPQFTSISMKVPEGKSYKLVDGVQFYNSTSEPAIKLAVTDNSKNNDALTYEIKDEENNVIGSGSVNMESGSVDTAIGVNASKITTGKEYTVNVYFTDKSSNTSSPATVKFKVDAGAPTLKINNDKGGVQNTYWNKGNVTITANADDKDGYVSSFVVNGTCDGEALEEKTVTLEKPQQSVSGVVMGTYSKEGVYSISVNAYDEVGNVSQTVKTTFVIDKKSPVLTVTNGSESTLGENRTITFSVSDNYGIDTGKITFKVFAKRYDESTWTEQTLACTKKDGKNISVSYNMTDKDGKATQYRFSISGTDNSGNPLIEKSGEGLLTGGNGSLTSSKTYYVDKTKPFIRITDNPANRYRDHAYFNGAVTFGVEVTEQFADLTNTFVIDNSKGDVAISSGSANKSETFKVQTNGSAWSKSITYTAEGDYNLVFTATDGCDNVNTAGTRFHIDKTAPVITIDPDGAVAGSVNNTDVTLPYVLSDNMRGYTYTVHVVRRDASGSVVYDGDRIKNESWGTSGDGTSTIRDSRSLRFADEGDYTVTISAVDRAGNKAADKSIRFRIDKTAPVISISGMNDTQTSAVTASISVNEAYSLSYEGRSLSSSDISVTVTRKTDGTAAANVVSLGTGSFSDGNPHIASYSFNEDGEYTITVTARDLSGNTAATATRTFKIDSNAPVITATAVDKDGKTVNVNDVVGSSDAVSANYVDMSLSIEEAFFATNDVDIKIVKDGTDVSDKYFANYSNSAELSTGSQRFDEDGVYNITVTATDALGNAAESYNIVFTVDNVAPSVEPTTRLKSFMERAEASEDGSVLLNAEDFADILNEGYEALWDVNDTSVFDVNVKMDGVALIDFSDMSDGYHKIEIEVTDQVGHVTTSEFEFTYDGTAPRIIITGVEDGETVRDPFTLTIGLEDEDDEITSIVINGEEIDPSAYAGGSYSMEVSEYGTYVIEVAAKDKAGNVASTFNEDTDSYFTFTLREKLSPVMIIILIVVVVILAGLLVFIIMAGKRKKKKTV